MLKCVRARASSNDPEYMLSYHVTPNSAQNGPAPTSQHLATTPPPPFNLFYIQMHGNCYSTPFVFRNTFIRMLFSDSEGNLYFFDRENITWLFT